MLKLLALSHRDITKSHIRFNKLFPNTCKSDLIISRNVALRNFFGIFWKILQIKADLVDHLYVYVSIIDKFILMTEYNFITVKACL